MGMINTTFEDLDLYAGASWGWTESLSDYPASLYNLKLMLKQGISEPIELNGAANGDDFEFTYSVEKTAVLSRGDFDYQLIAILKSDESVAVIKSGIKYIKALLKSGDQRTYWEKIRDNCKDALTLLSEREVDEVSILGRTYKYSDTDKIVSLMKRAERELETESGSITGNSRTYKLRWTN